MVAVTQFLSEAAVRVTEELECLQVQHDSTGPLFLTQRRYCVSPLTVQGRNLHGWKYKPCVITSLRGPWQRVREILMPREHKYPNRSG